MTPRPGVPIPIRFLTPAAVLALLAAVSVPAARAQLPSPLDRGLWSFPGAASAPGGAQAAGFAFANRWLGEQPFDNPAARPARGLAVSGVMQRVSRQDLRSDNRQFSEQGAFIDFGGGWLSVPVAGFGLVAYAYQPVLRLEDNAFSSGEPGGPVQAAVITSNGSAREFRAGLAVSRAVGPVSLGAAGEFVRRADAYELTEQSGSPDEGSRHVDFSGTGFGGQAGIRCGEDRPESGVFTFGASVRFVPSLTLDGEQRLTLLSGDSLGVVTSDLESGLEYGASAGWRPTGTFRVVAGFGGRAPRDWSAFGTHAGRGMVGGVGGEFHDGRDPWTLRFGVGLEREDDVAEKRAGLVGIGLGWNFDHSALDVGLLHRSITRDGSPTSYDDRLVATVTANF